MKMIRDFLYGVFISCISGCRITSESSSPDSSGSSFLDSSRLEPTLLKARAGSSPPFRLDSSRLVPRRIRL